MKELSIEEKAKAYDEAIDKIADVVESGTIEQGLAEWLFPELKESEDENVDEKVRKALIKLVTNHASMDLFIEYDIHLDEALTWLEKQGEQKPAEKVEPKFKVGDWVVSPNGVYWHINAINNNRYKVSSTDGAYADWPFNTSLYHLWTIQDAKDGDVLAVEAIEENYQYPFVAICKEHGLDFFNSYCCIGFDGKFYEAESGHSTEKIHPATKEQHDLLFQKMKEAGYEWDAEKKELKKIEQKFAWSEEDEDMIQALNACINAAIKGGMNYISFDSKSVLIGKVKNWLKSLRPQNTWKPSEEHYELEEFAKIVRGNLTGISRPVIERLEAKYLQLTGNKMYEGFKD